MLRFALEVTEYVTADFRLFRDKVRQATMSCFGLDMREREILGILRERCWQGVRNRGRCHQSGQAGSWGDRERFT